MKSSFEDFFVISPMKRIILTCLFFIVTSTALQAQIYYEEEEQVQDSVSFWDRVYFGGNFSLNFGSDFTFVDISPLAGYMINSDFSIGLGATYSYLSREYILIPSGNRFKINSSIYGGRTFLRHNIFENLFVHTELEAVNVELPSNDMNRATNREWVPGFFVGGGIFQPLFGKGGVNVTILYNLLHDDARSPYGSAIVLRGGITL